MNFIKKHYEKIVLGVVMVALVVAVVFVLIKINTERQDMETQRVNITRKRVDPIPDLNLDAWETALKRSQNPTVWNYTAPPHNLINPVQWQRDPAGNLIKVTTGTEVGPARVEVTGIHPLYLTVTFEQVDSSGTNYWVKAENKNVPDRESRIGPHPLLAEEHWKKVPGLGADSYIAVKPIRTNATTGVELQLELNDPRLPSPILAMMTTNQPFRRIEGYTVDLKYDLEQHRPWRDLREGSPIVFANDTFTITAIKAVATNQYEVVLSAKSTGKKTTITYNP